MAARWRYSFYKLVPSWLSTRDGEKVLFSLGIITDAFIEKARRSLTARFPTYSAPTGLKMLGAERGIVQGRTEANAGFARRLREWRGPRGHLVRGTPFAMLRQVWNYFGAMACDEIDTGGNVYSIDSAGAESATHGGEWNWDVTETPVATAALDASAASDSCTGSLEASPSLLIGPGSTGTFTCHCDGTPGRLIFLHVGSRQSADVTVTPPDDTWTLLAQSDATVGTGAPYGAWLYYKIVGPYESFTTATITCTNNLGAGNARFIARAVNVTGVFPADPILEVQTSTGSGTSIATPALAGQAVPALGLLFVQGRLTTYSDASDGWTELGAERTAGATGIGIDQQYVTVATTGQAAGTVTLGATSAANVFAVTIKHKTPQDWFRFWLALRAADPTFNTQTDAGADVPGAAMGMSGMSAGDASVLRNLFTGARPWKMAGTRAEWAVISADGSSPDPDGTWGNWSKNVGGTQVQARPTNLRFVSLNPARNNTYAGTLGNYPKLMTRRNGTTYAGTLNSYPDPTLPGSRSYTTGATFPATIQLLDDGSSLTQ